MLTRAGNRLSNLWDASRAAGMTEPEKLLYRSNLLGSDKRITNYGGGNTSAKVMERDPLTGEPVEVLWVKGSGGDVGSIKMDGFATLYMDKLRALKGLYRGPAQEDEMVGYLPHCTFNLNARAASIDTPLHAFVPRVHVDHMHPDAIIAIAASKDSKALTREIFGDGIGWLPWKRPGFELGLWLGSFCRENPDTCIEHTVNAGSTLGAGHQAWMMNEINPLIWPSQEGIGHMSTDSYDQTVQISLDAGILQADPDEGAYRTDLAEQAREGLDGDLEGAGFQKGTVEVTPGGE